MVRNYQKAQIRLIVLVAPDGILGVTGDNVLGGAKIFKKGRVSDFDFDRGYLLMYSCKNKFLAAEETGILYYRKPEYKRNPSRELRKIEVANLPAIKRSR